MYPVVKFPTQKRIGPMALTPSPMFRLLQRVPPSKPPPLSSPSTLRRRGALRVEAKSRNPARTESPKVRNRRLRRKFNGTANKPRLSVFCSDKQLYAMLADDQNKKTLFYATTLQKSIRGDPPCSTIEAAQSLGEELIKACVNLKISEISSYDRNGFSRGERMQAFEIPIRQYGFLGR